VAVEVEVVMVPDMEVVVEVHVEIQLPKLLNLPPQLMLLKS
jgi:hypothetical protein